MTGPMTVLVLTPSIGGHYFGEILAGLTREIADAGGRLVVVETLEVGARSDTENDPGEFVTPVALLEVDGVVSITTAVGGPFLQRLRDAHKPVVLVSTLIPGFAAPAALPDNHDGTKTAVEHLIGHGHTRIGFVGNMAQQDVRDRYAAYHETLAAHGLAADPALMYAAPDNDWSGGIRAARDLLAAADRPTALMVATDRNAIGLMGELAGAGLALPGDLAIVGFDCVEAGAFSTPTLTSVSQRFDEVGALAGRLVLAQMRGEAVACAPHFLPTSSITVRGSCGCGTDALGSGIGARDRSLDLSPEMLRIALEDRLCGVLLNGSDLVASPLRDAVLAVVADCGQLLHDGASAAQIHALMESIHLLTPHPEVRRRIAGAVSEYVQHVGTRSDGSPAAETGDLTAALWQLQAGAFLEQVETTETALQEQYAVDAAMLDSSRSDPRHLGWLSGTHVLAGALALWEDGPSSGRLWVTGTYDPDGLLPGLLGTATTVERFPPANLIAGSPSADRGVCVVVPVRTREHDWGLLAVIGEINTTSTVETYHHWVSQLCSSFEQEELQEAVRESEERYALAARATNDGLWEWDLHTWEVYMSDRCCALLGLDPGQSADRLAQWEALVHPDDQAEMHRGMRAAAVGTADTVSSEYRVRTADGSYRWMLARALGVRSDDGPVDRVVGSLTDIHDRRSLEDQLRENALYDALTGLPNRRLFIERLERSVALWQRSSIPFAVIFLDLDGFKAVNDTLGHQMGDHVLTEVGTRICDALRAVDTGARFGGDEFAILLHDVAPADIMMVLERVQVSLSGALVLDGHEIAIRASLGVATSDVEYECAEDVLRDADAAMYRAKAAGRGTVSFFDTAMHAHSVARQVLHAEVRQALDDHQFEVQYQPIVNLTTGRTDRFEALTRWRHPERGLLPPDEFLPLMQEVGLIIGLGHWVIDEVCRQLAAWGPDVVSVSISLSDREFWHEDLLPHLLAALEHHELTADRLTLEITEAVILQRPEAALTLMRTMHDAGLRLQIDDFGTGYSSLQTLHGFPIDAITIDLSVIRALTAGARTAEIVSAMVTIGRAMDLAVVAQGVQSVDQLAFLKEIGCATGQGIGFMPAVSGERALDLLDLSAADIPA